METVGSFVQSINPNLLAIAIVIMMVAFIIMMCIYIPRIEKLRQLENDKKRYKAERDYAVEQWSIAVISGNRQKDKILQDLKNTEGRKCQYSKIAKTMAEAYDKLKEQYGIDIPQKELPVVTFTKTRIIPREDVMMFSDECIAHRLHDDMAIGIGEEILKNQLAEMVYSVDKMRDRYIFTSTVKVVDPKVAKIVNGLCGFRRK